MLGTNEILRYSKQIKLKLVGLTGQEKLKKAKVLVIGAGGLGCPLLQYIAASGIGNIGIVDFDVVSESNLHRQILYSNSDIGKKKVEVAKRKLNKLNPFVNFETYTYALTVNNAFEIISAYDYIVDACDSVALRYMVSDVCEILNKPYLYAAISDFEGQLGVFYTNECGEYISYRDYFPFSENILKTINCTENGVIPTLPGLIALYQSNELIKIILGIGDLLVGKIKHLDILNNSDRVFTLSKSTDIRPKSESEFLNWKYPIEVCGNIGVVNVCSSEFHLVKDKINRIIDVREASEFPEVTFPNLIQISSSDINEIIRNCTETEEVLFLCQSGKRSLNVASIVKEKFPEKKIYNLLNGINELNF